MTIPAIEEGLARAGRSRDEFEVVYPGFVVAGADEEAFLANRTAVCKQVAFYGSTPAYRAVLETHGWGDLQEELNAMSKRGLWDEMGTRITDEILDEFAVVAEQPEQVVPKFKQRFGGLVDRTSMGFPWADAETTKALVAALHGD